MVCHFCIVVAVLFLFGFALLKLIYYLFYGQKTKKMGWFRMVRKPSSFYYFLCSSTVPKPLKHTSYSSFIHLTLYMLQYNVAMKCATITLGWLTYSYLESFSFLWLLIHAHANLVVCSSFFVIILLVFSH